MLLNKGGAQPPSAPLTARIAGKKLVSFIEPARIYGGPASAMGTSIVVRTAHNLRTAADIAGTYKAAAAGLTVVAGGQVARFQNENGVILELVGAQLGLAVSLGSAGMTIALQPQ